ncbi:MAG: methylated-DNA--[protein]-cysteine S-methyltransferase [Gemmatimonadetes bacterium]|nr:methylated-DNA--[protein]-cysteine S-methyltransferase [Gemmatimonadota bacterium]
MLRGEDYGRIEQAILYLDSHFYEHPGLGEVARSVGLSEYHFQRLFTRWAGISPKRFLQFLTAHYARDLLREPRSLLQVTYHAGLSGPSRLHDLIVSVHAVTPGELKRGGAGLTIRYGTHASPFGECLIAVTERGICALSFLVPGGGDHPAAELRRQWPHAQLEHSTAATGPLLERIFTLAGTGATAALPIVLKGTNFQIRVWEALLRIPPATVASYDDIAAAIGAPRAARAVGAAVGRNRVAFLIPCHRVIRKTGAFGEYHWGAGRKKVMLAWEAARAGSQASPA